MPNHLSQKHPILKTDRFFAQLIKLAAFRKKEVILLHINHITMAHDNGKQGRQS
jgi:hypothetical protein